MTKDETLRLALENINKAHAKVTALCEGSESWTMSVPPRPDYDHDMVITNALLTAGLVINKALAQPEREWVGLTDEDWKDIWEQFDYDCDFEVDAKFQEEMEAKHGAGFYIISPEESWDRQQKLIQKIVEAKLKQKNGYAEEKNT